MVVVVVVARVASTRMSVVGGAVVGVLRGAGVVLALVLAMAAAALVGVALGRMRMIVRTGAVRGAVSETVLEKVLRVRRALVCGSGAISGGWRSVTFARRYGRIRGT
jgi:hypothetical protein